MTAPLRSWTRRLAAVLTVAVALVAPASRASAHANVVGSEPPDGAVSATPPSSFTIRFDERVDPELATFSLSAKGADATALAGVHAGGSAKELTVDLPDLADGVYRVAYKVRDPLDLHVTAGSVVFGVGKVVVQAGGGDDRVAPRPADVALRWLERIGLALLVGGAVLALLVLPRLGDEVAAVRRALGVVGAGAAIEALAIVGLFVREVLDIGSPYGRTAGKLLASGSFGRRVLAGLVVAGALVALTRLLRPLVTVELLRRWRARRPGELGVALAVMVVASVLLVSLAGHSSTGGSYAVGVVIRLVHLLAMGAWAGGLVVVVVLRREVRRPGALVAAFSWVGLVSLAVLVVTGLLLTGREVATVTALLVSWFGRLLLVKLAVLVLAGVWGVRHARAVGQGRPVRTRGLRIEAVLALAVVAGGAALSTTPPAVGSYYEQPEAATPPPLAQTIGDVVVKLTLKPNRPGPNLLVATVASNRRPEPAPITGVTVDFRTIEVDGGQPIKVTSGAPQNGLVDFGEIQLPIAGLYQVEVQVERPGAPLALSILQWRLDPPAAPHARTAVSDASLAPWANLGAAFAAVLGLALVLRRARRGVRPLDDGDGAGDREAGAGASGQPFDNQAGRFAS